MMTRIDRPTATLVGAVDASGGGLTHPGVRSALRARAFFEALVVDNLDIGRPEEVQLIFTGKYLRRGRRPKVDPVYKTKIVTRDTDVTVNAFYKHSRIKAVPRGRPRATDRDGSQLTR